ncbi:MAG TPA: DUF3460 family protein [Ramlibacter sp.]|jgi:hypothetical protein|nr:DUF3460 family protein [Ramlibacter sp.]
MASFLQRIFRRPDYKSDVTQFIEQLKADKPQIEAQQRAGRALWWDKHLDREQLADWKDAKVAAKPYAYGDDPRRPR